MRHGLSAVLKAGFAVGLVAGLGAVAVPALGATRPALVADPAALVDPFIGTAGGFNTFPGADVPFGMIQWSPDTQNRHDGGGYDHGDNTFRGFSLTHMSGPGCGGVGGIPIPPLTGGGPPGAPRALLEPVRPRDATAPPRGFQGRPGRPA